MATAAENRLVNAAGLVQGVTLVTFPAASSILTSSSDYDLSRTQYGLMFLPQVVTAIVASLVGSRLGQAISSKRVLLLGLAANLVAMLLLLLSATVQTNQAVAFPLLLLATAFLGMGFGLTVPTVNTFVARFHPETADRAVLTLNALLGLGTALAPLFVAIFVGLGFWWGLPLLSAVLLVVLLLLCSRVPLRAEPALATSGRTAGSGIPARFWLFAGFAVLYGLCETMNGNWSQLYMTGDLGATATQASLALTAFWAMVTVGRVLFASISRWVPSRFPYHILPFALACAFALVASLSSGDVWAGVVLFALAGLGCSALLPLTISLGQEALTTMSAAVAGGVIAFYQIGYGIAAFGVGPLLDSGHSLAGLYGLTAVVAVALGLVSFVVAHGHSSPQTLHPQPTPSVAG